MPSRVFISHAGADRELAAEVAERLRPEGITADFGDDGATEPEQYKRRMLEGVRRSASVVVLLSSGAAASPFVMVEVGAADALRKPILTIRQKHGRVPEQLKRFKTVALDRMSADDVAATIRDHVAPQLKPAA